MGPRPRVTAVIVTRCARRRSSRLATRLEALGTTSCECPLVAIERDRAGASTSTGYDWVVVTSPPASTSSSRARAGRLPHGRGDRARHRGRAARGGVEPALVPRGLDAGGAGRRSSRARPAACSSPAPRTRAAARRAARRRRRAALPHPTSSRPELLRGRSRRARLGLGRRGVRRARAATCRRSRSGPRRRGAARAAGSRVVAEAATHDLDGASSRPIGVGSRRSLGSPHGRLITFLTDFGLEDDFVGDCHGVMKRIAPDVEIIDITHGIPPQQVLQGALVLCNTLPYMPVGVHLAVVDPGVGGHRRPLALRRPGTAGCSSARTTASCFLAAERLGGVEEAHRAREPGVRARHRLAHVPRPRPLLAGGGAPRARRRAERARPAGRPAGARAARRSRARGRARTGSGASSSTSTTSATCSSTSTREDLERAGVQPGVTVELEVALDRYYAIACTHVRRRRRGRHHPLRGLLRKRRDRDQRRERGARCSAPARGRKYGST